MLEFQITNEAPITLVPSIDANGNLELSCGNEWLSNFGNRLHVQHTTLPVEIVVVAFDDDASNHWEITVEHEASDDTLVSWDRDAQGQRCHFRWPETNQFHQVTVTVTATSGSSSATKKKLVFIKVRPYPDAPDS